MSNNRTLWIELDSSTAAQGRVVVSCGHSNETSGVKKGDQFLNSILPTFYSV